MLTLATKKFRLYILTVSVAAITATGAWYGAGLKTRQEFNQEKRTVQQFPVAEKIEALEAAKAKLVKQRAELQQKIDQLTSKSEGTETKTKTLPRGR